MFWDCILILIDTNLVHLFAKLKLKLIENPKNVHPSTLNRFNLIQLIKTNIRDKPQSIKIMDIKSTSTSPSTTTNSIDLTVFEKQSSCKHNDDPKLCQIVQLLLTGLRYYSLLDLKNDQTHKDIFDNFINEIYSPQRIIMHYFHLRTCHGHQIHDIMQYSLTENGFQTCDIDSCKSSSRLYRSSSDFDIEKDLVESSSSRVMEDLFDGIHHYIFHLFDCGLRDTIINSNEDNEKSKVSDDEYFDHKFFSLKKKNKSSTKKYLKI